jgi:hypothetical protein
MSDPQEQFEAVLGRMKPETLARLQTRFGEHRPVTVANWEQRQAKWEALPGGQRPRHANFVGPRPYALEEYLRKIWYSWQPGREPMPEEGMVRLTDLPPAFFLELLRAMDEVRTAG